MPTSSPFGRKEQFEEQRCGQYSDVKKYLKHFGITTPIGSGERVSFNKNKISGQWSILSGHKCYSKGSTKRSKTQ